MALALPIITSAILDEIKRKNLRFTAMPNRGNAVFKLELDSGVLSVIWTNTLFDHEPYSLVFVTHDGVKHRLSGNFNTREVCEFVNKL